MKLIHLLKIYLGNTTNPTINMTSLNFFNPTTANSPFFQAKFFQSFTTEIFRKLIDLLCEGSWSDISYDETILCLEWLLGERFIYLQLNNYLTAACRWPLTKVFSVVMYRLITPTKLFYVINIFWYYFLNQIVFYYSSGNAFA